MKMKFSRVFAFPALFFAASLASAQLGPPATQSNGAQATQLPLSGRTAAQNGSVASTQSATPGTTTSVNTINSTVQVQGTFAGSASSTKTFPFSGKLSLREAVDRGLGYNLGSVAFAQSVRQAQGQQRVARSSLLPNLNGSLREDVQQTNLAAQGLRVKFIPAIVGPFNYFDLRATLTQTVADLSAINNYRSAKELTRANQQSARDARDLVVLAVGGAYLETIAAKARVESGRAALETSKAVYEQTKQQHDVGLVAQIDVNRSLVQMQTEQQRLTTLENDFAKQKINLARLTGLPPNDRYELTDDVPYAPAPELTLEDALKRAFESRSDLKAAEAQLRAAERSHAAAKAERIPSLAVSADYGAIGLNPSQSHGTFTAAATLRIPIWQGGKTEGDIEQADAAWQQRKGELEDLRSKVESDVRDAFLDLQAAASQVEVAKNNQKVLRETLDLTRQRYEAGITDSVEVVQSQQSVASADLDFITSLFAHNLAKLSLARAIGQADQNLPQYLTMK